MTSNIKAMKSRAQDATRGTRWTARIAALCPAFAVLLSALVLCLGLVTHGQSAPADASMTTVSTAATGSPAEQHLAAPAEHASDCPYDDMRCHRAVDAVRAVLAAPAHPLPAILPRSPDLPRPPDTARRIAGPTPACRAPDLHVLQVQRT
ncbi:hypothetical protein QQY66_14845 [Streptomyces sp. DG2A-72]|uniref:hypothetical protein n=1 Tax=Streptomyces sp. DG2A-72 TaxID=3051386 RepID=UPI00265C6F28|nr:hypothetical protein [Streptomyces sp. DG2A-72]MDO0932909.1 hypothetical protein [Streptomyces sp. DG2A-72]